MPARRPWLGVSLAARRRPAALRRTQWPGRSACHGVRLCPARAAGTAPGRHGWTLAAWRSGPARASRSSQVTFAPGRGLPRPPETAAAAIMIIRRAGPARGSDSDRDRRTQSRRSPRLRGSCRGFTVTNLNVELSSKMLSRYLSVGQVRPLGWKICLLSCVWFDNKN